MSALSRVVRTMGAPRRVDLSDGVGRDETATVVVVVGTVADVAGVGDDVVVRLAAAHQGDYYSDYCYERRVEAAAAVAADDSVIPAAEANSTLIWRTNRPWERTSDKVQQRTVTDVVAAAVVVVVVVVAAAAAAAVDDADDAAAAVAVDVAAAETNAEVEAGDVAAEANGVVEWWSVRIVAPKLSPQAVPAPHHLDAT